VGIAFKSTIPFWAATSPAASAAFTPNPGDFFFVVGVTGTTGTATITQAASTGPPMQQVSGGGLPNFNDGFADTWSLWYQASAAGSSTTVTLTASGDTMQGIGLDYAGVAALKNSSILVKAAPGTGAGALVGSAITVKPGDLLIVVVADISASAGTITAANGSPTTRLSGTAAAGPLTNYAIFEYAGTGAAFTPTFTVSGGSTDDYVVLQFALVAASSSAPGPAAGRPTLRLGTPNSRLRGKTETNNVGQLVALAASITVATATLIGIPAQGTQSVQRPGLRLTTPLSLLRGVLATSQVTGSTGTLAALGASSTVGSAALTGAGSLDALAVSSTAGESTLTGVGALAALGASSTVGDGGAAGSGALTTIVITATAAEGSITGSGALGALAVSDTTGAAAAAGAGTLATLAATATTGEGALSGAGMLSALATSSTAGPAAAAGSGSLGTLAISAMVGHGPLATGNPGAMSALGISSTAYAKHKAAKRKGRCCYLVSPAGKTQQEWTEAFVYANLSVLALPQPGPFEQWAAQVIQEPQLQLLQLPTPGTNWETWAEELNAALATTASF